MNDARWVRALCRLGLGSFVLLAASCQSSSQQAPVSAAPAPALAPGVALGTDASSTVEAFGPPQSPRQLGSAALFLPGAVGQRQVNFATVNGQAVLDGDIVLGPATTLLFRYGIPWQSTLERKSAVAVASRSYLWPDGEIPYAIDGSAENKRSVILNGMRAFDGTPIKLRPRTTADRDYVVFKTLGDGCWSYLGRQGGAQDVDVTSCAAGNVSHELMHAAGFYHEQSRGDRDDYITIVWNEITPDMVSNFDKRDARGQDIGAYDYGSIMHYSAYSGSRTGKPTIIPRQPNVRIGQRDGLSPLDRAAIDTLYGTGNIQSAAPPVATLPPAPMSLPPAPVTTAPPVALPSTPPSTLPTPTSAPASNTSFTGNYSSPRGSVSCNQGGLLVQCQYPGGSMFCAASGLELGCTWSGGGQGRATFQRQPSGVLAGTWGDGFSTNSRGAWDLTPVAGKTASVTPAAVPPAAVPRATVPPATVPPAAPAATPAAPGAAGTLSGNFSSTRGSMVCAESGASVSCNFQEADGVGGRLDCARSQNGLELSCAWLTYFPRPATGRATFTRQTPTERRLSGTWGLFLANTGGGRWDAQGM